MYPPEQPHEPVIYELGKRFGVVTRLRRGNLSDTQGWVELEVIDSGQGIEHVLAWASERGLRFEPTPPTG
jgi:hypothetical protein